MKDSHSCTAPSATTPENPGRKARFVAWLQDPMGGVIAASVACIGAFGTVLSGTWLIHLAMN